MLSIIHAECHVLGVVNKPFTPRVIFLIVIIVSVIMLNGVAPNRPFAD
jgi:hypothetical protein